MSQFRKVILTDNGRELISKIIAGSSGVSFTKVALSAQSYADDEIPALTVLSLVKQASAVSRTTKVNDATIKITAACDNLEVTEGYSLCAIGLYAVDPDLGEILYGVAGADVAGYIPAYNGVTVSGTYINFSINVANVENVNLTVDPAASATIGDILNLENDIAAVGIESTAYPGCFYRMFGTEKAWINPPMVSGVEYRTTEYFDQYPVWTRLDSHYVGTEYKEVKSLGISSYDTKLLAIRCISRRLSGIWEPSTSYTLHPGDPLSITLESAGADPASEPGYHRTQIWYTKNDDTPTGGFG